MIKRILLATLMLNTVACDDAKKDDKADKTAEFKKKFEELAGGVADIKSGDDFSAYRSKCTDLMGEAMIAGAKLTDAETDEYCKWKVYKRVGVIAKEESKPGVPSALCMNAKMNVGEMVNAGFEKEASEKLLKDVTAACGA